LGFFGGDGGVLLPRTDCEAWMCAVGMSVEHEEADFFRALKMCKLEPTVVTGFSCDCQVNSSYGDVNKHKNKQDVNEKACSSFQPLPFPAPPGRPWQDASKAKLESIEETRSSFPAQGGFISPLWQTLGYLISMLFL
jgi:hypothetical protein